jgi:hypothetical protein
MKSKKAGNRHPLLLYQRSMDRFFWPVLLIGIVLLVLWWVGGYTSFLPQVWLEILVFSAGIIAILMAFFIILARRVTYVQTFPDHLRLITPFLRVNISYRRMRSVHSSTVQQLFPPDRAKGAEKNLLEPYYGKTIVVVELNGYPMSPNVLKLFMPKQMLIPKGTGFVLITPDWMALSTEIDTAIGNYRQAQQNKRGGPQRYRTY